MLGGRGGGAGASEAEPPSPPPPKLVTRIASKATSTEGMSAHRANSYKQVPPAGIAVQHTDPSVAVVEFKDFRGGAKATHGRACTCGRYASRGATLQAPRSSPNLKGRYRPEAAGGQH